MPAAKLFELSLNAKPLEELLLPDEEPLDNSPPDELLEEEELLEDELEEVLEELEDELELPGAALAVLRSLPQAAVRHSSVNKGTAREYCIVKGLSD